MFSPEPRYIEEGYMNHQCCNQFMTTHAI